MKLVLDCEEREALQHCESCSSALVPSSICARLDRAGEVIFLCCHCLEVVLESIRHHLREARVSAT